MKQTWIANVLTSVALIVAGIWVVAEIKSTTTVLATEISNLRQQVEKLGSGVDKLNDMSSDVVGRLIALEEWRRNQRPANQNKQ